MQHYASFHLGLHCLQKYSFREFPEYKRVKQTFLYIYCLPKGQVLYRQVDMALAAGNPRVQALQSIYLQSALDFDFKWF